MIFEDCDVAHLFLKNLCVEMWIKIATVNCSDKQGNNKQTSWCHAGLSQIHIQRMRSGNMGCAKQHRGGTA